MLMCARCAYAYHCKCLPSYRRLVVLMLALVKLSSFPQTVRSGWHQVQEVYRKRSANVDGEKNTFVLGFQAQQDFVLSCAFYSAIQVLKSSARHQLKKSPSSLIFSRYILFIS